MRLSNRTLAVLGLLAMFAPGAWAGIYTDDLTRCTIESTTPDDRTELVKWMFTAASAHPAVKPLSNASAAEIDAANETMGKLFIRILTKDCKEIARKAFTYEGAAALSSSMQVLGQVAGQELFAHPDVAAAMASLEQHTDDPALKALLEAK